MLCWKMSRTPLIPSGVGVEWLLSRVEDGTWTNPSPIGFYFAKLWYFEAIYPLVWTVGALRKARKRFAQLDLL